MSVLFGYAESGHEVAFVDVELDEVAVVFDEVVEPSDTAHGSVALGLNDAG